VSKRGDSRGEGKRQSVTKEEKKERRERESVFPFAVAGHNSYYWAELLAC
jgi:hypothetical protein